MTLLQHAHPLDHSIGASQQPTLHTRRNGRMPQIDVPPLTVRVRALLIGALPVAALCVIHGLAWAWWSG